MTKLLIFLLRLLKTFGFNPIQFLKALKGLPNYLYNYYLFSKRNRSSNEKNKVIYYPCLTDRFTSGGTTTDHYFIQDLHVARKIYLCKPSQHVDIGSRIDGFVAHLASFRSVDIIDIRPNSSPFPSMNFIQADCMQRLPDELEGKYDSASCLHALEHFGLGRYGDTINPDGHILGLNNLVRLLKPGGTLYLSVPIGSQRIEFDAHRVFSIQYLVTLFSTDFTISSFSYINDSGQLFDDAKITSVALENNFECEYGCGIFELARIDKKISPNHPPSTSS